MCMYQVGYSAMKGELKNQGDKQESDRKIVFFAVLRMTWL